MDTIQKRLISSKMSEIKREDPQKNQSGWSESSLEKIRTFLGYCILNYPDTKFEFHPTEKLRSGACEYTGEALKEKLTIATGGNLEAWLQVFLHETCHLDQAQENQEWFDSIDPHISDLDDWLENKEPVNPVNWESVSKIVEMEHDCEKRALKKIKDFNLPINPDQYAQKANAYLKSYIDTLKNSQWESAPYNDPSKWSIMPNQLMPMSYFNDMAESILKDTIFKDTTDVKLENPGNNSTELSEFGI